MGCIIGDRTAVVLSTEAPPSSSTTHRSLGPSFRRRSINPDQEVPMEHSPSLVLPHAEVLDLFPEAATEVGHEP